ncbi:hypothetical protein HYALB_00009507 [Hymenoscyphus albidus]|uniref:Uncharacterized protein n=1 Tax=Hymenoscyphus albidus TaxID=595503 RepID=A0A9N9LPR3_9HELO|nr:hypothetical protein HYALB_00009507 [Hymenoscyphus albidus]
MHQPEIHLFGRARPDGTVELPNFSVPTLPGISKRYTNGNSPTYLFITRKGYIGLGPLKTQLGDEVYILRGGKPSFILCKAVFRKVLRGIQCIGDSNRQCFEVIGDCYAHGLMDGGAFEFGQERFNRRTHVFVGSLAGHPSRRRDILSTNTHYAKYRPIEIGNEKAIVSQDGSLEGSLMGLNIDEGLRESLSTNRKSEGFHIPMSGMQQKQFSVLKVKALNLLIKGDEQSMRGIEEGSQFQPVLRQFYLV